MDGSQFLLLLISRHNNSYWGTRCSRCAAGYAQLSSSGRCELCFRSETEKVLAAFKLFGTTLGYAVIILFLIYSAFATAKTDRDSTSILLKILISWLQVRGCQ